jgi:hypothetical protein
MRTRVSGGVVAGSVMLRATRCKAASLRKQLLGYLVVFVEACAFDQPPC